MPPRRTTKTIRTIDTFEDDRLNHHKGEQNQAFRAPRVLARDFVNRGPRVAGTALHLGTQGHAVSAVSSHLRIDNEGNLTHEQIAHVFAGGHCCALPIIVSNQKIVDRANALRLDAYVREGRLFVFFFPFSSRV